MVTTCATPECLRPPASGSTICQPCSKGLPPMTNPKSPHAATNKGGFVPRIEKSGKPIQDGKEEMGVAKVVSGPTATQKATNKDSNSPKINIDRAVAKRAVQMLFDMNWHNWADGYPEIFEELFVKYGNFIAATVVASSMTGTPDTHRGTINMKGDPQGVILVDIIYLGEGERETMRSLDTAPLFVELRKGKDNNGNNIKVSTQDMMKSIQNNETMQDFVKASSDGSIYKYELNGKDVLIPRWAIG